MSKYKLDFYRKNPNPLDKPIFFRSQFIQAKNLKEVALAVSIIGNYSCTEEPDSEYNYENSDYFIKVLKFNKKLERYI